MAAVDVLPIAQPAARPDPAGAREPAPNDAGGSFANVLETEVDAADKTDGKADATGDKPADPALANAMAASAQPAPSPHTPTVNTAAAAIAAVLQAPEIQQTSGDKPAVETSGPTDAPASPNRSAGTAIPVPAISIGVPAESAAPKADTPAPQAALLAAAASASEAPTESVPTTAPAVAAAGSASPKAVKAQAAAEASERDST